MKCPHCKKKIESKLDKIMNYDFGWFVFVLIGAIWNIGYDLLSFSWALQLSESLCMGSFAAWIWDLYKAQEGK